MYVYIRSEPTLWTVGFYRPDGRWEPDSDHGSSEEAAKRVAWLNGSRSKEEGDGGFEAYKQRVLADLPPKKFITFND